MPAEYLVLEYLKKKLPSSFDGGTAAVDARVVAQAMIASVEHDKNGEKYFVGGKFVTLARLDVTLEKVWGDSRAKIENTEFFDFGLRGSRRTLRAFDGK